MYRTRHQASGDDDMKKAVRALVRLKVGRAAKVNDEGEVFRVGDTVYFPAPPSYVLTDGVIVGFTDKEHAVVRWANSAWSHPKYDVVTSVYYVTHRKSRKRQP
jgi:hypothetical protein